MHRHAHLVLDAEAVSALPARDKVHFLNPNGRRTNRSLGDATGLTGFGFHHIEIPAGADSTEAHRHFQEDEAVYVLSGEGFVELDDERHAIGPGSFIGMPKNGPAHNLHNPGPEPLVCLVVGQRLPFDVADYPAKDKRIFRHEGGWELVDKAAIVDPRAGRPDAGRK